MDARIQAWARSRKKKLASLYSIHEIGSNDWSKKMAENGGRNITIYWVDKKVMQNFFQLTL
jgi:hypothetical protein